MPENRSKPEDPEATVSLSDKTGQEDDATQPLSERSGRDVAAGDDATIAKGGTATEDGATVRVSKRRTHDDPGDDGATAPLSGDRGPDDKTAVPPPDHPKQIQHFRIIRTLGQGGMGAVYLAEQSEPVKRQVALKLVHTSLRGGNALARFNAERQAMARLSHPNIAALFEAGATDDGFPFFAMEVVPGDSLTEYCDKNRVSLDKRLELFSQVCAGVQHAHQKGIIHRDLKPSNLLVTEVEGEPIPKVIDFGIAKALDEPLTAAAELTGHGAIGTPAYMSPEALAGSQDLDTRTDVYSLGMVLYELLTGIPLHNPLKKVSGAVIADWKPANRASGELAKASTAELEEVARKRRLSGAELESRIRGDLDWIMMKAVAEEPDRRYESAAEFAADIERHLAFEPVVARPPSATYRTGRFVRRHRIAVTGGALAMLALILGIVGTSIGLVRARQAEGEARLEAQRAEQVSGFMTELFTVSDPGTARGNVITVRELLDRGATRIRNELADQPQLQARLMGTMTTVYSNLGLYDQAVELEEQVLALREALLGDQHPDVAASLTTIGDLYRQQSRYAEAKALLQRAVGIYEPAEHPGLANSLDALATVEFMLGNDLTAEAFYRQVIAMREGTPDTKPLELAASLHRLGWLLGNQHRYAEAETRLLGALEIRERELGEDHFLVAENLKLLAAHYTYEGRFEEAEQLLSRALAIEQRVLEPDHPNIGESFLSLGTLYRFQGRMDEAESHLRSAMALFETALGPDHLDVARALDELGMTLAGDGRWQEAESVYRRQLEIFRQQLGDEHQFVGQTLNNLGWVLSDGLSRYPEGEEVLLRAVALFDANPESDDYWKALSRWSLANNLRDQHRHADAEPWYAQAVDLLVATGGPGRVDNPDLDQLIADYALSLRASNREEKAVELEARFGETGD